MDDFSLWETRHKSLVWSDEFDGAAGSPVNPKYWTPETGGFGWWHDELQYYTDGTENAALDGISSLAIVARRENRADYDCHYGKCRYTSARLITKDRLMFTYGRVEARIRIPRGQGLWPAFWLLGSKHDKSHPISGEIDIMENIGKEPRVVHGTLHGPGYYGATGIGRICRLDADYADDFHVFAVDWEPNAIRWYVDGTIYLAVTPGDLKGNPWVFNHSFYILLNVAVGGWWPGSPDETTVFPQTMLVDYVRVYRLDSSA